MAPIARLRTWVPQGGVQGAVHSRDMTESLVEINAGRIYHDPSVPELVCRYPEEPIVTVLATEPRAVEVDMDGQHVRIAVRNGALARVGRQYLLLREGSDQGLWLLLEPGDSLE